MTTYHGACHCGRIAFAYTTRVPVREWSVRACQCTFCRLHGARCTSDPQGSVRLQVEEPPQGWYRFALGTADFLVCPRCGVYVGAVIETPRGRFATLNVNTFRDPLPELPAASAADYGAESTAARVSRRERGWTRVLAASSGNNAPE